MILFLIRVKNSFNSSGEKTFEEFYSDNENYDINTYESLGFINSTNIDISYEDVEFDFEKVFNNPKSKKSRIALLIFTHKLYF